MGEDATLPEVFIIESLPADNPREGDLLKQVLTLAGKAAVCEPVTARVDFSQALVRFGESEFRYLHISCHGSPDRLHLAHGDLDFLELGYVLRPRLRGRRLFLSACELANEALAREVLLNSGCYSMIGPRDKVGFADAALVWASFYHLLFRADRNVMKRDGLLRELRRVTQLFDVPMNYFSASRSRGIRSDAVEPRGGVTEVR